MSVLPFYSMLCIIILIFVMMIVVVSAIIVLLVKAIRYSGEKADNQKIKTNTQYRYDPYRYDDMDTHCPQCNNVVTKEFHYCPKCGTELKRNIRDTKDKIVKISNH